MDDLAKPVTDAQPTPSPSDLNPLDVALVAFRDSAPILKQGFFDHGPMAAEALEAMGLSTRIADFTNHHLTQAGVVKATPAREPTTPERWRDALGQGERFSDWVMMLTDEIEATSWRALARRWVPRLTPGATTAALHGLIRTAHAVRALERRESDARKGELVRALASWAALYGEPPWSATKGRGTLSARATFQAMTPAPKDQRAPQGSISAGLGYAMHAPDFVDEMERLDAGLPLDEALNTLVITLADAFLAQAHSSFTAIVWCHALTVTLAVQRLRGVLSEPEARTLFLRVFEAACAMKVAFTGLHAEEEPGDDRADARYSLAKRAAETGDEHAIKLTDALLEGHDRLGDERLLLAANRGIRLLGR